MNVGMKASVQNDNSEYSSNETFQLFHSLYIRTFTVDGAVDYHE